MRVDQRHDQPSHGFVAALPLLVLQPLEQVQLDAHLFPFRYLGQPHIIDRDVALRFSNPVLYCLVCRAAVKLGECLLQLLLVRLKVSGKLVSRVWNVNLTKD